MLGGVWSMTVTLNEQLGPSSMLHDTSVVPTGNTDPDDGTQVTEPLQSPDTWGVNVTTAPQEDEVGEVNATKSDGQIGVQEGVPVTITHAENSEVLFEESVAVAVITLPIGTLTGKVEFIGTSHELAEMLTVVAPMKV